MRPYDGREYRYRFDDETRAEGLVRVARLLQLPVAPGGARFDLSFYSGGFGIIDRMAIAIPATRDAAAKIARTCGFAAPDLADDDLQHLIQDDEAPLPFAAAIAAFIARQRAAFQPDFTADAALWIEPGSGVNHWGVIWHTGEQLAFLAYDQG